MKLDGPREVLLGLPCRRHYRLMRDGAPAADLLTRGKANRAAVFTGARREPTKPPAGESSPPQDARPRARGVKGVARKLLDGGTLSLGQARAMRGSAEAPPLLRRPPDSGQLLRLHSLCAGIEEGEKERERRVGKSTGTDSSEASTSSPPVTSTALRPLLRLEREGKK
jgi:hypothetical protein